MRVNKDGDSVIYDTEAAAIRAQIEQADDLYLAAGDAMVQILLRHGMRSSAAEVLTLASQRRLLKLAKAMEQRWFWRHDPRADVDAEINRAV